MRKKHVLLLVLLPAIALMFAIFGTGCTSQPSNEQHYESFLYERDFPNFTEPYDWSVWFDHDELLDVFNFIADYWDANPYCDMRNAIIMLLLDVPENRVRVGLDSDSEELRVAFRANVLDSTVIRLEDARRGMGSLLSGSVIYNRTIYLGTGAILPNYAQSYNSQQEYFTFAELRDTMTAVADFLWADRLIGQDREIRNAISTFFVCVNNNRVIVSLLDYSEELKEEFGARVVNSPAILFADSWQR